MAVSKSTVRIVCAAVCVGRIFQKAVALCQDLEEGEFEVAVDEKKHYSVQVFAIKHLDTRTLLPITC